MDAAGMARVAEAAATMAQSAQVLTELARLTPQLSHAGLQSQSASAALQGLQACEAQARRCIQLLVQALGDTSSGPELPADAAWMLNKLTQHCDATRQWVLDAGGGDAIRQALITYPGKKDMVLCAVWITYTVGGLAGLTSLLATMEKQGGLPDAVVAAAVWVVYELKNEEFKKGSGPGPDAEDLLRSVIQVLSVRSADEEVMRACCYAIEALVRDDPRLGALLQELGGARLLLLALHRATELHHGAEELAAICAGAVASIAQGGCGAAARAMFRDSDAPALLLRTATRGRGTFAEERAMVALGQLAGLDAVLRAMVLNPTLSAVIRGGLDAIVNQAERDSDPEDITVLPKVLQGVMELKVQMDGPDAPLRCRRKCHSAVCSVIRALAPHAEPGCLAVCDHSIRGLLEGLQATESPDQLDHDMSENSIETLGRVALTKESWRRVLMQWSALDTASLIIQRFPKERKLVKYSFWFAAAVAGLPFVATQLTQQLSSTDVVDAAFCTLIDILDEDIEGEWVLKHTERCSSDDVPGVLALVVEAMQRHPREVILQSRGCHCIGLLIPLAPPTAVLTPTLEMVLASARHHARSSDVTRDACFVLRAALQHGAKDALLSFLRQQQAQEIPERILTDFLSSDPATLEDSIFVLSALSGVEVALKWVVDSGPGTVRTNGVKALFELGRQQPHMLRAPSAEDGGNGGSALPKVASAVLAMARDSPDDQVLQQNAELLVGLCQALSSWMPAAPAAG